MNKKILVFLAIIMCSIFSYSTIYADTKIHPTKIKKDYEKIEHDKELTIRYFDVNKINIEPREKKDAFYILKEDKTRFNEEDIKKMLISKQTIKVKNNEKINIMKIASKECIGYNFFQNREKQYTTYQIGITNKEDSIVINTKNEKLYLDVFYLSSKKVYVRHINATSFYDEQSGNIIGFDETQIAYAPKISKENKVASVYDNVTNNKEKDIIGKSSLEFQEEYIVPIDKNIEVYNVLNQTKKFLGYKKIVSSNKEEINKNKNNIYDGSITRIGNLNKRIFTEKGCEDTYIDMFYIDRVMPSNLNKIVGEVIDANIIPEGKVFAKASNDIFNKNLKEFKIPSSEEIKLGIIDVKPYIVADMAYVINNKLDLESNGKVYFELPYRYAQINNLNLFTIKDSVVIKDKEKRLLEKEEKINVPLKEEYLNKTNSIKHIPFKVNKNYIEENTHENCKFCKKTYLQVEVSSDALKFADDYITEPLEVKTQKYLIKEEKCKEFNGQIIKDERATKYFTPNIKSVEKEAFEDNLIRQITNAKKAEKIVDIDKIYKDNKYTVPAQKENGEYTLTGELEYENKYKVGKTNSKVQKVNLILKDKQLVPITVYTPIIANGKITRVGSIINHTDKETKENMISKNTPFIVTPLPNGINHQLYNKINDYEKYIREYMVKFNFDLDYYKVYNSDGSIKEEMNSVVEKDTNILVPKGGKVEARAVSSDNNIKTNGLKVADNKFTVTAIAINAPTSENYYKDLKNIKTRLSDDIYNKISNSHKNYHNKNTSDEKNYAAKRIEEIDVLNRIFDFRIVNIRDYDFDSIFKKEKSQLLSGNFSYAGNRRVNLSSGNLNELYTTNNNTLPLGPYKHKDPLYKYAPKIGYYFDFDLKTTGAFTNSTNKCIKIKPEFYYISKDGSEIKTEDQIDLYYNVGKDRKVKVGSSQDTFRVTMAPYEAESYIKEYSGDFTEKHLSKNEITLGSIKEITLNANSNMVKRAKDQEQIWVGRYKLPNSLFVVNKGEKDLKRTLNDGYLGVIFKITYIEKEGAKTNFIDYSQNDKSDKRPNTSQWDMEGNLNSNYGTSNNLSLKLENGNLTISNELYSKIKGTVMLFDLDRRAQE